MYIYIYDNCDLDVWMFGDIYTPQKGLYYLVDVRFTDDEK